MSQSITIDLTNESLRQELVADPDFFTKFQLEQSVDNGNVFTLTPRNLGDGANAALNVVKSILRKYTNHLPNCADLSDGDKAAIDDAIKNHPQATQDRSHYQNYQRRCLG
jgi:hypothetical protein